MQLDLDDKSKFRSYEQVFKDAVETYNTKWIHSVTQKTPTEFVRQTGVSINPWQFRRQKILPIDNKERIDKQMKIAKRLFPLSAIVRLKKKYFFKKYFVKKAQVAPWSLEKFRIIGYKRPLSFQEPVGYYLRDINTNKKQSGVFYGHEIKVIKP